MRLKNRVKNTAKLKRDLTENAEELERLTIFTSAEIARRRKKRGSKLNVPEAIAYICDEILELAHDGKTVAELISHG